MNPEFSSIRSAFREGIVIIIGGGQAPGLLMGIEGGATTKGFQPELCTKANGSSAKPLAVARFSTAGVDVAE